MDSRERVLAALACRQPDRVPFMFACVDAELQEQILGRKLDEYRFDVEMEPSLLIKPGEMIEYDRINYLVHPDTARKLELDAIGVKFCVPFFADGKLSREGYCIERGYITSRDDWKAAKLPDVNNEKIYQEAKRFVQEYQGEFAVFANIRLGCAPSLLSMGYDHFSYLVHDDIELVYEVVETYTGWVIQLVKNINECGFDFLWAFDDIAFKSNIIMSIDTWVDVFRDRLKKVTDIIACPWIYHSDGNVLPILDQLLTLGMSGFHPMEPGACDIEELKAEFGKRLCLIGNIDVGPVLSEGTPELVEKTVKERMDVLAPNGGYIISDSNSVPYYCRAENIIAMSRAVRKYRDFYR